MTGYMQFSTTGFLRFAILPMIFLLLTARISVGYTAQTDPPFFGTIFIDPDIIVSSDPTTFLNVSSTGQGSRTMFDRRISDWITVNAFLFDASYEDGFTIEIQVNPEFGSSDEALAEAQKYAPIIGRLPRALRTDVQTVWIHKGIQPFGGGNNNLLIHTGQADLYVDDGILEEVFVHEASHTSLDATHASAPEWLTAQTADGVFISNFARDFPNREDIAESFLPYLAVRFRPERISQLLANTILQTIPNRMAYFDSQTFDMHPVTGLQVATETEDTIPSEIVLATNYPNPFNPSTNIRYSLPERATVELSVYDAMGRLVDVIVNQEQAAGWHEAEFEAAGLPSGIYFYRLEAGRFRAVRAMVLLR